MNKLPKARNKNIVVQNLNKEILIYDLNTHKAYNLNETSAIVYQACDGETTIEEFKQKSNFTDEIIFLAIDELSKENLIADDSSFVSPFEGMSRREVIRKVGSASMIALPIISFLVAPAAVAALSCRASGQSCTGSGAGNCCTNNSCISGVCRVCLASGSDCTSGTQCCAGFCSGGTCA